MFSPMCKSLLLPATLLLFSCSSLFPRVLAATGDVACTEKMCISARVDDAKTKTTYELETLDTKLGWMAIGFGDGMLHTPMIVVWPADNGTTILSQRSTAGYREPKLVQRPECVATLTPHIRKFDQEKFPKLSFDVPYREEDAKSIVWAFSPVRPQPRADAKIRKHTRKGIVSLDLTNPVIEDVPAFSKADITDHDMLPKAVTTRELVIAHGLLASLGFLLFLPSGALMARWRRPGRYNVHMTLNVIIGLPLVTLGMAAGMLTIISKEGYHFNDTHKIRGAVLYALYLLQVVLGSRVVRRRNSLSRLLHRMLGLSIITAAFYQVRSGFDEWESVMDTSPPRRLVSAISYWAVILSVLYLPGWNTLVRKNVKQ